MRLKDIDPKKTVRFIGDIIHRGEHEAIDFKEHIKFFKEMNDEKNTQLFPLINLQIDAAIEKGYDTFLTTFESIFEITATIVVLAFKHSCHKHIKLVYVTLRDHYSESQYYLNEIYRIHYNETLELCTNVIEIEKSEWSHRSLDACKWFMECNSNMSFQCNPHHLCISDDKEKITITFPKVTKIKY